MDVTLEDAYAEACKALGESVVTQRLMATELARLTQQLEPDPPVEPQITR